jgi:hypothetical protein
MSSPRTRRRPARHVRTRPVRHAPKPAHRLRPDRVPVPWPKWLKTSKDPLDDYFEAYDEVPTERALFRLFRLEKARNPAFQIEQVDLVPGRHAYLVRYVPAGGWRRDVVPTHVYTEDRDGSFGRQTPDDLLQEIQLHGEEQDYFDHDPEQRFNDGFWDSPGPLYHGTDDPDAVMEEGIGPRSETRGLNNRGVGAAVFTSGEPEAIESYSGCRGCGLVEIDTGAMKRDGYTPRVSQEPEVLEQDLLDSIAHRLGLEYEIEYGDAGIDPATVIIHGPVPARYLRLVSRADDRARRARYNGRSRRHGR